MKLVIVESPTKAKTIQRFLGDDFVVKSSFGHVRDLPKKKLGIDTEHDFEPQYVIPLKAKQKVGELRKSLRGVNTLILATDEDREGEAIAWHVTKALKPKNAKTPLPETQRIAFHEITKKAIEESLKNPRQLNMDLVDAQQARRILDRLVGYKLSPFLWYKVAKGLSAGRVQSVAVRLIVEREREIENFKPEEYWSVEALLRQTQNQKSEIQNKSQIQNSNNQNTDNFKALLIKKDEKPVDKFDIKNEKEANKIIKELSGAEYRIVDIEQKEARKNPLPPFTTSTLQQAAWQKLRFPAKLTMGLAQNLYENGHITYHRTDSLSLSEQSLSVAKDFILKKYGKEYWPGFSRKFKTKSKGAQEAHEAIRPTDPSREPSSKFLIKEDKNVQKLYDLIWRRFVASQMSQAIFDSTSADIETKNPKQTQSSGGQNTKYTFRTTGQVLQFDGFLKIYPIRFTENELPALEKGGILDLKELIPSQHFTQPPPRYNDASLVKKLEELGIGRPSTYAPIISTIQDRRYVEKNTDKRFIPTEIGMTVNDLLVEHFSNIVDYQFTAEIEKDLDKIAEGKIKWVPVIHDFYTPFAKQLDEKYKNVEKLKTEEPTDRTCPQCGGNIIIRSGRFGKFYACKNFPDCRFTETISDSTGVVCPQCFEGEIIQRKTKKGKTFFSCSKYPKCEFALWNKPTGEKCPKCGSLLMEMPNGKEKCSNKACDFNPQAK